MLQVGDAFLPESNAACLYLADPSPLVPADRFERADMFHWLFWEQYNHEPNIATLLFWRRAAASRSRVIPRSWRGSTASPRSPAMSRCDTCVKADDIDCHNPPS